MISVRMWLWKREGETDGGQESEDVYVLRMNYHKVARKMDGYCNRNGQQDGVEHVLIV